MRTFHHDEQNRDIERRHRRVNRIASVVRLFAQPPVITAVVNGGSFQSPPIQTCSPSCNTSLQPGLASNTWVSIFGTNLALITRTWSNSDFVGEALPTTLDGVSVMMSVSACYGSPCPSSPAYVEYISPTQLNVLTPDVSDWAYPVAVGNAVQVVVTTAQVSSNSFSAQILPSMPAFFTVGGNYVAARHADGTLVGKTNMIPGVASQPARPGEIIELHGTGFGPTNPALPIWNLVTTPAALASCPSLDPTNTPSCPVVVIIGEQAGPETWALTQYAGLVESGLYQINVTVPDLADGDVPVAAALGGTIQIGGFSVFWQTQEGLLITVQTRTDGRLRPRRMRL